MLTTLAFVAAACFPGWLSSGFAFSVTAVAGLSALGLHAMVGGRPRWTLQRLVIAITLVATALAGWNLALREARARAQMVGQVLASGGRAGGWSYRTESWLQTREGILLPTIIERVLGEQSLSPVTYADVPAGLFTVENTRHWPLGELRRFSLLPGKEGRWPDSRAWDMFAKRTGRLESFSLYNVDHRAVRWSDLKSIQTGAFVVSFGTDLVRFPESFATGADASYLLIESGTIDDQALATLAKFPKLESLTLGKGNFSLTPDHASFARLQKLKQLLLHTKVDAQLQRELAMIPELTHLTVYPPNGGKPDLTEFRRQRPDVEVQP